MKDLVDVIGIRSLLEAAGTNPEGQDFEGLYDSLASSGQHGDLVAKIERRVGDYFSSVIIPDECTVYDYLLLALRPKDLVATFNWDPLLAQAFKRNANVAPLPRLAFLHGNVALGYCRAHRTCGWIEDRCANCRKPFDPAPVLFPVRDKDYTTDEFIANEWQVLRTYVNRAYFLTVFGYSAPRTDVAAQRAMLEVWRLNGIRELAEVEIIDLKTAEELQDNWREFITRQHYVTTDFFFRSSLSQHPRRSCDAQAAATLQNAPWKDDALPHFQRLNDLQNWIQPLVQEEHQASGARKKFSGVPCCERHQTGQEP